MTQIGACAFPLCGRRARAAGLCSGHYRQAHDGEDLRPLRSVEPGRVCTFDGCGRAYVARGLCRRHYQQWRSGKPLTSPLRQRRDGITSKGYRRIRVPGHPNAGPNGSIFEHTYVMSQMLGRPLLPGENVHHKNGIRHDNRPENLELWVSTQPRGQRPEDLVAWAHEILDRYELKVK